MIERILSSFLLACVALVSGVGVAAVFGTFDLGQIGDAVRLSVGFGAGHFVGSDPKVRFDK